MSAAARLADEGARRRIRADLGTNLLCQASAGAGKTHALVERMVACVASGAADIGRMAAITFTRKAAGHMKGRFFAALQDAAHAAGRTHTAEGARQALRLHDAVRRVDECAIGTIHALCARLLRERPVEAQLPPDFTEVEEREELWLARDAWDRFLQARAAAGDERLLALEDTGLTAELFYHFFLRRCQYSDLSLKPTRAPRPDLTCAVAGACQLVRAVDAQIPDPLPEGEPDDLMQTVRRLRHVADFAGPQSDADRESLLRDLASPSRTKVTLRRWGPPGSPPRAVARSLRDEILPGLQEELAPLLAQWRRHVYALASALVDEAMDAYRDARRAAATVTFNDLLEGAAALLRERPRVRVDLQARYARLFVDEFQDTDPLQAEVLLYLTATEGEGRDWRRLTPRPGSLFLVGDEKQSIYRFRRADVDVFRLVRDRVLASGGDVVELTTSFRSRPALTHWLNDAFEPLFDGVDPRYQSEFARQRSQREEQPGAGVYRLRGRADAGARREQQVRDEAERIADFIAAALRGATALNGEGAVLGRRAAAGDFMVLTRSRRHLAEYARALELRAVPYDISGAGSLRASRELRALVDALESVLRGDDPVALVAYLRGPVVGLGDDELYRLRQAGWSCRWTADPPDGIDGDLRARLQTALTQLRSLRGDLRTRPPAAALERFVDATGLAALAVAQEAGSSRAGNLVRVLSLVRDQQDRRGASWARVAAQLRDLLEEEELRVEEMTLETGRTDVVRVMNLHQAKGLEAKVVFLADPADTSAQRHGIDVHVSRLGDEPYVAMAVTCPGRHRPTVLAEPEGWDADADEESRFTDAEELRLVYVAATRAREILVVGTGAHAARGPWSALSGALNDVPDLPSPPRGAVSTAAQEGPALDIEGPRRERAARWRRALEPSFARTAVTDDDGAWTESDPETRGRGRRYGMVVHRLFESAVCGRLAGLGAAAEAAYAEALLRAEGLGEAGLAPAAVEALARLRASALWREVEAAGEQVHTEVPFARADADGVRRGVIDLVYRVDGGWKVVDFKTHRAEGAATAADLGVRYADQVAQYAAHWEVATGERVVARGLWLAASDGTDRYLAL